MKKYIITLLSCVFFSFFLSAQINIGGMPYSLRQASKLANYNQMQINIEKVTLPSINIEKLNQEDLEDQENGLPLRFGYSFPVDINMQNKGTWIDLENGDRLWMLEISCPSAKSINLLYDKFYMPDNATLYLYSKENHQNYIGGFSKENNQGDKENPGKFSTDLISGDHIIIEYYEPKAVKNQGEIVISTIVHGYKDLEGILESFYKNSKASDCQVDINCSPEGNIWQKEKRSVARIIINGAYFCTGSLINNVAMNNDLYFLTADHCLKNGDAVSSPEGDNFMFYWNYENSGCKAGTITSYLSTSGASVIANNSPTDFALLKLKESPINRTDIYFAGWDRGWATSQGVGIHHPRGGLKKIATYTSIPIAQTVLTEKNGSVDVWDLYWSATPNGFSVTEGGSSGSPLFNANHRIIGQLLGGGDLDCENPSLDFACYGRFDLSWGNNDDPRRRLKDWLDPYNKNLLSLSGVCGGVSDVHFLPVHYNQTRHTGCTINISGILEPNSKVYIQADHEVNISSLEIKKGSEIEIITQ